MTSTGGTKMPSTSGKPRNSPKPETLPVLLIELTVCACSPALDPLSDAAIALAEHIFAARGAVQLLSGHKAKGLEWDTVYHLDPFRVPTPYAKAGEALEQELNVRYVIETRAKHGALLHHLDGFTGGELACPVASRP